MARSGILAGRRRMAQSLFLLSAWPSGLAWAQGIEFRIAFEDKDSPDHTGTQLVPAENPGIIVEMVQMLPARLGGVIRLQLLRRPWARCLAELESGQVDAIFSSSFRPERLKLGVYPMKQGEPDRQLRIDTKAYSLYTLSGSALRWDGQRFSGVEGELPLVAMRGYAIVDELRKFAGVSVVEVDHAEVAFRMLQARRVLGFAHLSGPGDYLLRRDPELGRSIAKAATPLMSKDYFLQISHAFAQRQPELTKRIWQALGEIRQSEHERLIQKYAALSS